MNDRRTTYAILITAAVAACAGRILNANLVYEPYLHAPFGSRAWPATTPQPMPTFSSNDRSRWCTVRALVDEGTYVIGRRVSDTETGKYRDTGIVFEDGWQTVDKVLNPVTKEFYSSKPPLLATLVAGEYWVLKHVFGLDLVRDCFVVVAVILLTCNALPLLIALGLLARLAERFGGTDWGRYYVVAAGCFGTLLLPFMLTFNNHTPAACAVLFALYPALRVWSGENRAWLFAVAGFFAGFAATNELPALAFTAALFAALAWAAPWRALVWYVPAAAVPLAALALTNYLALGELTPAYDKFGTEWYEYEGSHWKDDPTKPKRGIDWAWRNESRAVYAFHVLFGHHGLFSLTPVNLLAVVGMLILVWRSRPAGPSPTAHPDLASGGAGPRRPDPLTVVGWLALVLTLVVLWFYIVQVPERNRNYGGWTSGPRWLLWLTPLWLISMMPAADKLARSRWGRGVAYALLAVSVVSASYPAWNPWRHPWLYRWMEAAGWIEY